MVGRLVNSAAGLVLIGLLLLAWPGLGRAAGEAEFAERVIADFSRAAAEVEREAARRAYSAAVRRHFDLDHLAETLLPRRWRGMGPDHRDRVRAAIATYIIRDAVRRWQPGAETNSEIVGMRQISNLPGVAIRTQSGGRDEVVILVLRQTEGVFRVGDIRHRGASLITDMLSRMDNVRPMDMSTPNGIANILECRLAGHGC